jgi:hypothetical protein
MCESPSYTPEARTIARAIPPTFSAMVERAGQDNNHLQKAVNVHESAFTWVRRYKTSNTLKSYTHKRQAPSFYN